MELSTEQTELTAAAELLARGFPQQFASTTPTTNNNTIPPPITTTTSQHRPVRSSRLDRPHGAGRSLSSPTSPADSVLHPLIRLGGRSLCSVACNGLTGEFLGGHDRDQFIQCTSAQYAGLPLIDTSLGGCIMTCSQFERVAGRELSKKWKESIHVVNESTQSPTSVMAGTANNSGFNPATMPMTSKGTLLSWLKRKAEIDFGEAVVGKKVWVGWCADSEFYQGTIVSYNREAGKHTVSYSSRLTEDLHLPVELLSFSATKPSIPLSKTEKFNVPSSQMPINPVWHQGSGVSVNDNADKELKDIHGFVTSVNNSQQAREGLRSSGHRRQRESSMKDDYSPPGGGVKRAISAPAAVLLAEAVAVAQAMAGGNAGPITPDGQGCTTVAAVTPAPREDRPTDTTPLPEPPPGQRVDQYPSINEMVDWMYDVALQLEDKELLQFDLTEAGPLMFSSDHLHPSSKAKARTDHHRQQPNTRKPSSAALFQALVPVLLSTSNGNNAVSSMFEAMKKRFVYYNGDDSRQRQKMAEYVVAAVEMGKSAMEGRADGNKAVATNRNNQNRNNQDAGMTDDAMDTA